MNRYSNLNPLQLILLTVSLQFSVFPHHIDFKLALIFLAISLIIFNRIWCSTLVYCLRLPGVNIFQDSSWLTWVIRPGSLPLPLRWGAANMHAGMEYCSTR